MANEDQRYIADRPDSGWRTLTLQNSWTGTLEYRIKDGIVHFRGQLTPGTLADTTVLTNLAAIARPSAQRKIAVHSDSTDAHPNIEVEATGDVEIFSMTAATYLSMDGVSYHL